MSSPQKMDDYPPPPPPPISSSVNRNRSRERSMSPRRSSSRGRYLDRQHYREDYQRDRYDYPRREYYDRYDRERYDRYDHHHRDRYDRRGGDRYHHYDDRRGRYPPKPRQKRPVDRGSEQERKTTTTIYAGNLPYDFLERDVATMFERYGRLKSVTVPLDPVTNKNKGFAFVEFEDRRDAEDAFEKFDGFSVEGRRLKVDWDIGLNKKNEHRPTTNNRRMEDHRERPLNDPYGAPPPPPPPPMDSRGYRRESPEPYRR